MFYIIISEILLKSWLLWLCITIYDVMIQFLIFSFHKSVIIKVDVSHTIIYIFFTVKHLKMIFNMGYYISSFPISVNHQWLRFVTSLKLLRTRWFSNCQIHGLILSIHINFLHQNNLDTLIKNLAKLIESPRRTAKRKWSNFRLYHLLTMWPLMRNLYSHRPLVSSFLKWSNINKVMYRHICYGR